MIEAVLMSLGSGIRIWRNLVGLGDWGLICFVVKVSGLGAGLFFEVSEEVSGLKVGVLGVLGSGWGLGVSGLAARTCAI